MKKNLFNISNILEHTLIFVSLFVFYHVFFHIKINIISIFVMTIGYYVLLLVFELIKQSRSS
ncbi:hypothetical protein CHH55_09700 [Niallia circulans]|nr:hypothetical protein CHH62_09380 [Niallia circulans]PAD88127.1 hypothetical protein CHH55_09700 [Niallia circulans]